MTEVAKIASEFQNLLADFIKAGKIDREKSNLFLSDLHKELIEKQVNSLKKPLQIRPQRVLFNAMETLISVSDKMRASLNVAFIRGEKPTTAENCAEIVPLMVDLGKEIDLFNESYNPRILNSISNSNRLLRKRAEQYKFLKTAEEELKGIKLSEGQIGEFINDLNQDIIETELELK